MRVINVIEILQGTIMGIESFGVFEEQLVDDVVECMEEHFLKCIKKHSMDEELLEEDIEEYLDNGYFSDDNGYEVSIIWSDIY